MPPVKPGRHTANIEGDFVVFIIGMRFNKPWLVARWWPVFTAMPKMLTYLESHPDKGLLGSNLSVSGVTLRLTQYWRSFDHLEAFAKDTADPHLEAWRRYNQEIAASGDVGVFHETFKVTAGSYEAVYANMPVTGLAAAAAHAPLGSTSRARTRIAAD